MIPLLVAVETFQVDDYAGANDGETINRAFVAMRAVAGPKRLIFAARTYVISTLDPTSSAPVLDLANVRDLEVDGHGAVLEAHDMLDVRRAYLFACHDFEAVRIHGLHITYRPLPFVQGHITSVDQPGNRVEVRLVDGFSHIERLRGPVWCRAGLVDHPHLPKPHSPSWMEVATDARKAIRLTPDDHGRWTLHAGGFATSKTIGGRYTWAVGDPLVVWQRGTQDACAVWAGSRLRLENITVDSALHFALKVRGVEHVEIVNCRIEPAAGAWFSGSADGIDVQQCRDVTVKDCRVISNGDDAISFLPFDGHGRDRDGKEIEQRFPAPLPDTNEDVILSGNLLEGGNRNGILLLATRCQVRDNNVRHIRQYGIKCTGNDVLIEGNRFEQVGSFTPWRHIADELNTGIITSDEWVQRRWTIRGNNIIGWYHMPGILLKSVEGALVEKNYFDTGSRTADDLSPHNAYLSTNAAICLTNGDFGKRELPCKDIRLVGNRVRGEQIQPLTIHGQHKWQGENPLVER